ncbi:MAG: excinuclease ABC subunit UvrC [Marinifilaceae bacterium]|nr:excinuclease ABC subunit UvrC [Marinifilaceae bacterium]
MALYDDNLREKVRNLPSEPGVYQYFDASGKVIYIGKAKNLKSRVSSYLNKSNQTSKTSVLVKKIADLKYTVVSSEQDALLLENNLIKEHKPKYNILLKDDKTYPWIAIRKEPFPRVEITRRFNRTESEYFGPYTSVKFANVLMKLIKSLYKLRSCNLNIPNILSDSKRFKPCLEYHIHNCDAPCIGGISRAEYDENIAQIRNILKGNLSEVITFLSERESLYALNFQFEKANEMKIAADLLRDYRSKSTIVRSTDDSIDVFSFIESDRFIYVNYLGVEHGSVNKVHTIEVERKLDEENDAILSFVIFEIRELVQSSAREIIVPFYPDIQLDRVHYTIPQIGEKRHLLELSERNAKQFKADRERQRTVRRDSVDNADVLMNTMVGELKLPVQPRRIECFDNSNTQGTNPVSSCVVFIDGKPAKREYRKFHVKSVVGANDFASMEEIVYRRYARVLDEGLPLPDLIVIDGGKGQLGAALTALDRLNLRGKISILGLAERLEEIYFPGDSEPWILSKKSDTLRVLMQIRDEAHRFAITFHRNLRSKSQIDSELRKIKGIGPAAEKSLLQSFKSVERIKSADIKEIAACVGAKRAAIIYDYFHPNG